MAKTRWVHILIGGCKDSDPNEWCNGCFYRAWNSRHPDKARTNYDPRLRPLSKSAHIDGPGADDD